MLLNTYNLKRHVSGTTPVKGHILCFIITHTDDYLLQQVVATKGQHISCSTTLVLPEYILQVQNQQPTLWDRQDSISTVLGPIEGKIYLFFKMVAISLKNLKASKAKTLFQNCCHFPEKVSNQQNKSLCCGEQHYTPTCSVVCKSS